MSMAAYGNDHGSYMLSKAAADRSANGTVAPTHMLTMHQATPPQALPATKLAPAIVNTLSAAPTVHRAYSSPSICGGDSPAYMNGMRGMQSAQQHDFIPPRCNTAMSLNVPLREPDPPPRPAEQVVNNSLTALREDAPASTSWSVAQQPAEIEEDVNNDGEIDIQIRNVVCTYSLPLHIDLHRVALNSGNVTFDRGRGVLLKQKRNPMCYVKVYSSGKIYIVGCRSETECKQAARGVARMVQKCMGRTWDTVRMRNYRICNVLATCKMPFGIKIEEMAEKFAEAEYEPELSVGLVWKSVNPKATLRIHTTGSVTVTGAHSESDVMAVIEVIYPILVRFRCAMRLRDDGKAGGSRARKRAANSCAASTTVSKPKRQHYSAVGASLGRQQYSGAIGNRVCFSDEEDVDNILEY